MADFDVDGARKAGYSEAEIVDHLAQTRKFDAAGARSSGYSDAELLSHLRAPLKPVGPQQSGLLGQAALGARAVAEGAVGGVYDLAGGAINAVTSGINALAPRRERQLSDLITGAQPEPAWQIPRVRGFSENLTAAGVPEPETQGEKLVGAGIRGIAGLAPTMGAGMALNAAGMAPGVAGALLANPGSQVASALGGSLASEGASEAGAGPLGQLAAGLAGGVAAPMGLAAARRVVTPIAANLTPEQQRLIAEAQRLGIPLSPAQETGSKPLRTMESVFREMPFTSGPQANIDDAQRVAYNRAALGFSGTQADRATPDVLRAARNRIGTEIGDIANRNTLQVTPQLTQQLTHIDDSLRFIPAEAAAPIRARLEQLQGMVIPPPQMGHNGGPPMLPTIPGASYRMMDSQLGRSMRDTQNGDLRAALGQVRETLRTAMDNSISPQDAADWQQARRHYANLMNVNAAMRPGAAGADLGNISPSALGQAVNQSTGRGFAMGNGDMNDLARIGTAFIKESTPNSGTSQRQMMAGLLQGGVGGAGLMAGEPMTAAAALATPRLVQALYNTDPARRWLTNQAAPAGRIPAINPGIIAALLANPETP